MYFQQGIDIVEIRRISKIYEKFGINFLIKVLSNQELKIIPTQKKEELILYPEDLLLKKLLLRLWVQDFEKD